MAMSIYGILIRLRYGIVALLAHVPTAKKSSVLRNNEKLEVHLCYIYYSKLPVHPYWRRGACTKKRDNTVIRHTGRITTLYTV